jgi:hypothetical protein
MDLNLVKRDHSQLSVTDKGRMLLNAVLDVLLAD